MVHFCILMSAVYGVGSMIVDKAIKPMRFWSWAWVAIALAYMVFE